MGRAGRGLPDPEEVAAGRVRATVEDLFALVHAVNPTDRGLPARERERRYALKARLQSRLVLDHADVLEIVPDGRDPRVVGIVHRYAQRDACHVLVDALDDEARSRVRFELDAAGCLAAPSSGEISLRDGGASSPVRRPDRPARGGDDLLDRGDRALAEYDLEEARTCFEQAFRASRGSVPAVRRLLTLLVDSLADDPAALALVPDLPASADPEVAGLVARAAARAGDAPLARVWLGRAPPPARADALALLAEAALRSGDAAEAAAVLNGLAEADPFHPSLLPARDRLGALKANRRRPAEEEAERALAAGDLPEARARAQEVLAADPDSAVARAVLRRVAEREEGDRLEGALALLEAAVAAGERVAVRLALARIREIPRIPDPVRARLEAVDGALRAEEEAQARAVVVAALGRGRGLDADALDLYLGLPEQSRAAVRRDVDLPPLEWLEQTPKREGRVAAVLALEAARVALAGGDFRAALEALDAHSALLAPVREAARVRDVARERLRAEERAVARAAVQAASESLARGDDEAAHGRLAGIRLPEGDSELAEVVRGLRERVEEARARSRLRKAMEAADREGDAYGAWRAACALGEATGDADLAEHKARDLRAAWRTLVVEGPEPGTWDLTHWVRTPLPAPWLTADGRAVVTAKTGGRVVHIRVLRAEDLQPIRSICLRVPEPVRYTYHVVLGDEVALCGFSGAVLRLRWTDGAVVGWWPPPPHFPSGASGMETPSLAGDASHLWCSAGGDEVRVYSLSNWPSYRSLPLPGMPVPLLGDGPAAVAVMLPAGGMGVYTAAGTTVEARLLDGRFIPTRAAAHPGDRHVVVLGEVPTHADYAPPLHGDAGREPTDPAPLALADRRGIRLDMTMMGWLSPRDNHRVVSERDTAVTWVLGERSGEAWLSGYRMGDAGSEALPERWPIPFNSVPIQDAAGRRVLIASYDRAGMIRYPMPWDAERPSDEQIGKTWMEDFECSVPLHGLEESEDCRFSISWLGGPASALAAEIESLDARARAALLSRYLVSARQEAGTLLMASSVAAHYREQALCQRLFDAAEAADPGHDGVRLLVGCHAARGRKWADAEAHLAPIDLESLEEVPRQHALHLLGLAALHRNDLGEGARRIREGAGLTGACSLRSPVALVDLLEGAPVPEKHRDTTSWLRARIGATLTAVRTAEAAMEAGDPAAAVAALERPDTFRGVDRQSAARLAAAWLEVPAATPLQRLRKSIDLGRFLEAQWAIAHGREHDIPMAPHRWTDERLDALARRCEQWLEGGGDEVRPPDGRSAAGSPPLDGVW